MTTPLYTSLTAQSGPYDDRSSEFRLYLALGVRRADGEAVPPCSFRELSAASVGLLATANFSCGKSQPLVTNPRHAGNDLRPSDRLKVCFTTVQALTSHRTGWACNRELPRMLLSTHSGELRARAPLRAPLRCTRRGRLRSAQFRSPRNRRAPRKRRASIRS